MNLTHEEVQYRLKLLNVFLEKKLSGSIQLKIAKLIESSKDREQKAEEIVEKIQDCKTEEEVLKAIEK